MEWSDDGSSVRLDIPRGKTIEARLEHNEAFVRSALPSQFRADRLIRGLYKIALNLVAATDGMEKALLPAYDNVQRYIVRPANSREKVRTFGNEHSMATYNK